GANGRAFHAKIIAVQQVIGGHIIQATHHLSPAIAREYAPDDEIRHHTPHMSQEIGHSQDLPRLVDQLDNRMLAIDLQGRAETSVSQASGCLWAKTMTRRPSGVNER